MSIKQLILTLLFIVFIIYTIVVFTHGTAFSKGKTYLTHEAQKGKIIFQEKNCMACHQIYGLGGYMGPDLTNIISKRNNNTSIAKAFLKNGTEKMPDFELTEVEIEALIAYLKYLDQAGNYPQKNYELSPLGTVKEIDKK